MKWNDKRLRFAELGRSSTMLTIHPELLHRIWKGRFYSNFFIFLVRLNFNRGRKRAGRLRPDRAQPNFRARASDSGWKFSGHPGSGWESAGWIFTKLRLSDRTDSWKSQPGPGWKFAGRAALCRPLTVKIPTHEDLAWF